MIAWDTFTQAQWDAASQVDWDNATQFLIASVKERIELLCLHTVQSIYGIGTVYRWDMRGLRDPTTGSAFDSNNNRISLHHLDAMVLAGDEVAIEGGQGGDTDSTTEKTLPIEVHLKIEQNDTDPASTSALHNQWLMAIESAILTNPLMIEPGGNGERLAIDTRISATSIMPTEIDQREAISAIQFEVTYQHFRNDPAAGPGITHKASS